MLGSVWIRINQFFIAILHLLSFSVIPPYENYFFMYYYPFTSQISINTTFIFQIEFFSIISAWLQSVNYLWIMHWNTGHDKKPKMEQGYVVTQTQIGVVIKLTGNAQLATCSCLDQYQFLGVQRSKRLLFCPHVKHSMLQPLMLHAKHFG